MDTVDINLVNKELIEAALDGNLKRVQDMLKSYNADVNAQNDCGMTPAMAAAKRNDMDMLQFLEEQGADLTLGDRVGQTPLHWARHNNNSKMCEFIEDVTSRSVIPRMR